MLQFTPDGSHLLLHDGFGLTRITPPKAVKTDKALSGTGLQLGATHALAHGQKSNLLALRTVPGLERVKWPYSAYGNFALLPDGDHVVEFGSPRFPVHSLSRGATVASHLFVPDLSAVSFDLGRLRPAKSHSVPWMRVLRDGAFAVHTPYDGLLRVGRFRGAESMDGIFRAEIGFPVGELLFGSQGETLYLGTFDRGRREAVLYRLEGARVLERKTLVCFGAPVFSGTRWCWQESADIIRAAPWDDLTNAVRYHLTGGHAGVGLLAAHDDKIAFAPQHGESVVLVDAKVVVDRKLGAATKHLRLRAIEELGRIDPWLAAEGGALRFGHVEDQRGMVFWSPSFDLGCGSLSAHCAVGDLLGMRDTDASALRVPSYSSPMGLAHTSVDDVRRAFEAVEHHGARLLRSLCGLEYSLKSYYEPAYNDRHGRGLAPPAPAFDPLASAAVLRAIGHTVAANGHVPLVAKLDAWTREPITVDELLAVVHPPNVWDLPADLKGASSLPMITAWLALDALRERAVPVLARWCVTAPSSYATSNAHIISEVVARMIQYFPETEDAFRACCEEDAGTQGRSMWNAVKFQLRS